MSILKKVAAVGAVIALAVLIPTPAHAAGGTISGTVTGTDTSSGIEFVGVSVYDARGRVVQTGLTDSAGDYSVSGIPAGTYTVRFGQSTPGSTYAPEWYGDSPFASGAQSVAVTESGTVDADTQLSPGGSISGTVQGVSNIGGGYMARAYAWDPAVEKWIEMGTQAGATPPNYTISSLPGGLSYRVWFQHYYTSPAYASAFYSNASSIDAATSVPVASGEAVTGINQVLKPGTPIDHDRLAGADRFETSAQVALAYTSESTDTVFIANGLNYPDALSAGPVAARFDAPLLLTTPTSVPAAVAAQIERIDPSTIVVVGGEATVTPAVVDQLEDLVPGATVERVAGPDRYATSRALAEYGFSDTGAEFAYIATGVNFPDALSAAAVGGASGYPVILVYGPGNVVDTPTRQLIADLDVDFLIIAGGTATVSTGLETALDGLPGIINVDRLAGADRYQTSVLTNQPYNSKPADKVYLAVGTGFADALSGAALAARDGAPLFVVPGPCVPAAVRQQIYTMSTQEVVLLGGTAVLGTPVESLTVC